MTGDELALLRQTVRTAFGDLSPPSEVRTQMATPRGWDDKVWRRLCAELGVAGMLVPEEHGGSGLSTVELGVVFEEAGRALLCAPLFATSALAVPLLLALDDDAQARYLPGICDGSIVATVVTADTDIEVTERHGRPFLTGEAGFVVDGAAADLVLVAVRTRDGVGVFAVDAVADELRTVPLVTLDPTRKQARLFFDDAPAVRLGGASAGAAVRHAFDVARVLLSCEQAGAAGWCLETTVEYAKTRVQFGRPIGSFQAVKQKAADMLIQVESARSAARAAADAPEHELPVAAAIATSYCSEAFVAVAAETIQLHGGIGFTWDHDAHLYFKRAWTSRELLGRPEEHLDTLARYLTSEGDGHDRG